MKQFLRALIVLVAALASVGSYAVGLGVERYVEGVHYSLVPGSSPAPNTVVEFFSFGCPHCAHLEPSLEAWLKHKPESAKFSRIPATWNPHFEFLGQVYYVLSDLGIAEADSQAVFDYIHKENKPMRNKEDVAAFLADKGVDKDRFEKVWNDPELKAKLAGAGQALGKYQVRGVPSFLVNGQYMTSLSQAGSPAEMFDIIEFLLNK